MKRTGTLVGVAALALLGATAGAAHAKPSPAWLELYGGYATPSGGLFLGRVHKGEPIAEPRPGESSLRRALETIESLEARAVSDAVVTVTIAGHELSVRSDGRGYFEVAVPAGLAPPSAKVTARLAGAVFAAVPAEVELAVYGGAPGLGLISDVDDTLIDTGVTHKLKMAAHALVRSSWELRAFPGAATALASLVDGGATGPRPLIYISGSPWGFRRRLGDFFARAGFPTAPMVLKRFSREPRTDQMAYKWPHIVAAVDGLPVRRWILFGDSSESDPEIYDRLRRERAGRVEAIYIHLVTDEKPDSPRFRGMTVFREWSEVAADLARFKPAAAAATTVPARVAPAP